MQVGRIELKRDPFARASFYRERVAGKPECAWCGQTARFRYAWISDSVKTSADLMSKPVCGIACHRAYYD